VFRAALLWKQFQLAILTQWSSWEIVFHLLWCFSPSGIHLAYDTFKNIAMPLNGYHLHPSPSVQPGDFSLVKKFEKIFCLIFIGSDWISAVVIFPSNVCTDFSLNNFWLYWVVKLSPCAW
jgi:hypothetical protein